MQYLPGPLEVLQMKRLVEAVQPVVVGDLLRGRPRAEQRMDRPAAWEQVNQRQREDRYQEGDQEGLERTADQEPGHGVTVPPVGRSPPACAVVS